jgi:hypothetical protein
MKGSIKAGYLRHLWCDAGERSDGSNVMWLV